jgi:bacterial/archaeal transporter family protein
MAPWVVYALLAAVFAALVAIFGKVGISGIDTTAATAIRAVVMAVLLVTVALVLGKAGAVKDVSGRTLTFIVLSGVAGALSWLTYFLALRHGPVVGVAAIDRLSIVFVLLFAIAFLGDPFTWKGALGVILVVAGSILLT